MNAAECYDKVCGIAHMYVLECVQRVGVLNAHSSPSLPLLLISSISLSLSLSLQSSLPSPLPSKDDCLTHKERCLFSAHLVALQISLLPQGLQIINLTQSELEVFLGKHPSFQQVRAGALQS